MAISELKLRRCKKGITVEYICDLVKSNYRADGRDPGNISRQLFYRWEDAKGYPSVIQAIAIAEILDCQVTDLWNSFEVKWSDMAEGGFRIYLLKWRRGKKRKGQIERELSE